MTERPPLPASAVAEGLARENADRSSLVDAPIDRDAATESPAQAYAEPPVYTRPIVVRCVCPPIPCRDFDWCAFREGEEERGNYGWGSTPAEAIKELLAIEEDAAP